MSRVPSLADRLHKARAVSTPEVSDRAKRGLLAYLGAQSDAAHANSDLADGTAATGIGRVALSGPEPKGLACSDGCAFCCILSGADGGTITETEATALHTALAPLAGQPDGRAWHPKACPSLDPETRCCRAYEARPMICRAYVSTDVEACKSVSEGQAAPGPGTLGPYHTYLAAIGLSRAVLKGTKRVSTYALSRVAAAAVEGVSLDEALAASRHKPTELDAELKRSKRDLSRT
ncbi:MAG: YkgJ family cysteine cluster protein [Pelagibaca sp.]